MNSTNKELLCLIAICKRATNFEKAWLFFKKWYGTFYWGDESEHSFNVYKVSAMKVIAEGLLRVVAKVKKTDGLCLEQEFFKLICSLSPTSPNYSEYGEHRLVIKDPDQECYNFWLRVVAMLYSEVQMIDVDLLEKAGLWAEYPSFIHDFEQEYRQAEILASQSHSKFEHGFNTEYKNPENGESPSCGFILRCAAVYFPNKYDGIIVGHKYIEIDGQQIKYHYSPKHKAVVFDFYRVYMDFGSEENQLFFRLDLQQSAFLSDRIFE